MSDSYSLPPFELVPHDVGPKAEARCRAVEAALEILRAQMLGGAIADQMAISKYVTRLSSVADKIEEALQVKS